MYLQAQLWCLVLLVRRFVRGHGRTILILARMADAHAHLLEYGFKMQLRLDHARSLSALLDMVEEFASKHPSGPDTWVVGMGWDQTRWTDSDGTFPTAVYNDHAQLLSTD